MMVYFCTNRTIASFCPVAIYSICMRFAPFYLCSNSQRERQPAPSVDEHHSPPSTQPFKSKYMTPSPYRLRFASFYHHFSTGKIIIFSSPSLLSFPYFYLLRLSVRFGPGGTRAQMDSLGVRKRNRNRCT